MDSIHPMSASTPLAQFDLFGVPPTQRSVEATYETEHRPISSLSSNSFIEFVVPTAQDEYILFNETYLYVRIRIKMFSKDRGLITDEHWKGVKIANNTLHSLFKQIDVQINNREIILAPQTYAYRAYLETLLGFSEDAKKSHLTSSLWYDDEDVRSNFFLPAGKDKSVGDEVDLMGRLHLDFTFQNRALLGGVELKLKLTPHSSNFVLKAPTGFTPEIEFLDATLFVNRAKVTPSITLGHTKGLNIAPAKYPLTRCEVRQMTVPAGVMDAMLDNVVLGKLPRRIFVMCLDNDAFSGSYEKDPFTFNHNNINYMACYLDGVQHPRKAYQPNFENNLYVREYMDLMRALNQNTTDSYVNFGRVGYKNGKTIFGFNFAPDLSNGCDAIGHVNLIKRGALRIQMRFKEALKKTQTVLVYCEFDQVIEIDKDRNVVE